MSARAERLTKTLAAGGVLLLTVLFVSQMFLWINWWPIRIGWGTALVWATPQLVTWLLLAPLAVRLSSLLPVDRGSKAPRIAFHLAASILFAGLGLALIDLSDRLLGWASLLGAPHLVTRVRYTAIHLHWGTAIYWVVLAVDHTIRSFEEARSREVLAARLEAQLSTARLATLRAQLNPHFLFNALNSIGVLMRHDLEAAATMLGSLSSFLRATLEQTESPLETVAAELGRLETYLAIEQQRFGDRLAVRFEVDPAALPLLLPSFLLQPLAENAIRHGAAARPGPCSITVACHRRGDILRLALLDDGPGLGPRSAGSTGVGLENTRRRLAEHYGARARLELANRPTGGAVAVVELPVAT